MTPAPPPAPAARFARLIAALCAAVAARLERPGKPGLAGPFIVLICVRLQRMAGRIAQSLADAGLLAQPTRTVPTRDQIEIAVSGVLFNASNHPDPGAILGKSIAPLRDKITDAVLALMADQPTVAEVKAEALEEAADDLEADLGTTGPGNRRTGYGAVALDLLRLIRNRAQQIRDGK